MDNLHICVIIVGLIIMVVGYCIFSISGRESEKESPCECTWCGMDQGAYRWHDGHRLCNDCDEDRMRGKHRGTTK